MAGLRQNQPTLEVKTVMAEINLIRTMERDLDGNANEIVKAIVLLDSDEEYDESLGSALADWLAGSNRVAVIVGAHRVRWTA